jgi:transposase InsO family protein
MDASEITREKRLRRAAARQGLRLSKSARRNPYANDYGKYRVEDPHLGGLIVAGGSPFDYSLDLDEVEKVLSPNQHGGHGRPLRRDEDYENAITPHAPHDGNWAPGAEDR